VMQALRAARSPVFDWLQVAMPSLRQCDRST
jgi:hypothetical protein